MKHRMNLSNVVSRRICTDDGWQDWNGELNDAQRSCLVAVFGNRCRKSTVARLWRCVNDNCRRVKPCGILERVELGDDGCEYVAGQDYPSEIRTVRELMIASY